MKKTWEMCDCRFEPRACFLNYIEDGEEKTYETVAKCMEEAVDNLFHDPEILISGKIQIGEIRFMPMKAKGDN